MGFIECMRCGWLFSSSIGIFHAMGCTAADIHRKFTSSNPVSGHHIPCQISLLRVQTDPMTPGPNRWNCRFEAQGSLKHYPKLVSDLSYAVSKH